MALEYSPNVATYGLLSMYDAANVKSYGGINYVSYSNYNAATWTNYFPTYGTLTTGIIAPDGTATAVRITCTSGGNSLLRVGFPSFTPNGTSNWTASFYVRKVSGSVGTTTFDLTDATPSLDYTSSLVTGQWVRIQASAVSTATSRYFIDLISDGARDYVLDFWGVQVEPGLSASPLTTTTGSVATTNVTSWRSLINSTNNGTLTNAPMYSVTNNGTLTFTTSASTYSTLPSVAASGNDPRSMFCWVNVTTGGCFISTGTASTSNAFNLVNYGSGYVGVMGYNNDYYPASGTTIVNAGWKYIGATYDGAGTLRTYVNGVQDNVSTGRSYSTTGQNNFAGKSNHVGAENYITGSMPVVQIYSTVLSDAQVAQNFNALRGRYGV